MIQRLISVFFAFALLLGAAPVAAMQAMPGVQPQSGTPKKSSTLPAVGDNAQGGSSASGSTGSSTAAKKSAKKKTAKKSRRRPKPH